MKKELPLTWGEAAAIRTLQQHQRFNFATIPLHGSFKTPQMTFSSNFQDWDIYLQTLEGMSIR